MNPKLKKKLDELQAKKELQKVNILTGDIFIEHLADTLTDVLERIDNGIDLKSDDLNEQLLSIKEFAEAVKSVIEAVDKINFPEKVVLDSSKLDEALAKFKVEPVDVKLQNDDIFSQYRPSDTDERTDLKYYGYLNAQNNWFIMEVFSNKDGERIRYAFGNKDYDKAWKTRRNIGYSLFSEAVNGR